MSADGTAANLAARFCHCETESRPIRHEFRPLGQQIAAAVSLLDFVVDRMGQRHLASNIGIVGAFAGPIFKRRAEAMDGQSTAQAVQLLKQSHVGKSGVLGRTDEDEISILGGQRFRISTARIENGTLCSLPPFIRAAGIVQISA